MRNMVSNDMTWSAAVACAGSFWGFDADSPSYPLMDSARPLGAVPFAGTGSSAHLDARLRVEKRVDEQRVQVQVQRQGRSVFAASVFADIAPIAPTARKAATAGGVTGPHPWRQPV